MRILTNRGRTGGSGFCYIPLRKTRGPIHERSRKVRTRQAASLRLWQIFLNAGDRNAALLMLLWGLSTSENIHGHAGPIQPHRWLCTHKNQDRDTQQSFGSASIPWQNSSKCFPLEECLLPQLQAGIQIGSCFIFYPSSCLTERKHEEKEKLLVYSSIQEIFRKEDDWKIQIRTFSDKLKGKKKGSTNKQKITKPVRLRAACCHGNSCILIQSSGRAEITIARKSHTPVSWIDSVPALATNMGFPSLSPWKGEEGRWRFSFICFCFRCGTHRNLFQCPSLLDTLLLEDCAFLKHFYTCYLVNFKQWNWHAGVRHIW